MSTAPPRAFGRFRQADNEQVQRKTTLYLDIADTIDDTSSPRSCRDQASVFAPVALITSLGP